jgi:hypothetical protein
MSFQTILFIFGAILFLVGLIGHVKAKEIEVGSTSKSVRVTSFILGSVFIVLSLVYPFSEHQENVEDSSNGTQHEVSSHSPTMQKDNFNRKSDATIAYWEKCKRNDEYYLGLIAKEEQIISDDTLTNTKRGEALIKKANLIRGYMQSEEGISTVNVDSELVETFRRFRDLHYQRANHIERMGDVLLSVGDQPDDSTLNLANQRLQAAHSDEVRLEVKNDQMLIEIRQLQERLTRKYGREFISNDY